MNEYVIDGIIKSGQNKEDFNIELTLQNSQLKIKGLSKILLLDNLTDLNKEQGIYLLEGLDRCYIGQTKDISKRIKNHKDSNKVEFIRCFFLSQKGGDLRQYLDFMEAYTIQQMEILNYALDNFKKPNPDHDVLDKHKKNMVKKWIDEFLLFLPILGFRKSKEIKKPIITNIENNKIISIKLENKIISGLNNKEVFINFIKEVGVDNYYKNCQSIFNKSFKLTLIKEQHDYATCNQLSLNNLEYYAYINISKNDLIKKINKSIQLLNMKAQVLS